MVGKKQQKQPNGAKNYTPEIRYGTQRMNVLNHTISHSKEWDDKTNKGVGAALHLGLETRRFTATEHGESIQCVGVGWNSNSG